MKIKNTKSLMIIILIAVLAGLIAGTTGAFIVLELNEPTKEDLIKDFYDTENAVHVSPHGLRKSMDKGETSFILVDLRSEEEYNIEHIIGAVNIPAYKNKDQSDYGAVERITNEFKELQSRNPEKDLIVYCYSTPCMTGRKVGYMLAKEGIYVKHLGIGWNDWKYDWTAWNHEHEWNQTNASDYIAKGSAPGVPKVKAASNACPIGGSLGC